MNNDVLVKLDGIYKSYRSSAESVKVLKGLNICVERGQTVAIMGPSGSGKSTLLNIIGALDLPDKGDVYFNGEHVSSYSEKKIVEFRSRNIGVVFQKHHLLPQCTVLENVMLPTIPLAKDLRETEKKALELLKETGIGERADAFPSELSGGESQRAAVARALINDPDLLLADEPTGSLDHETAMLVLSTLKKFTDRGKTLIMVTHSDLAADATDEKYRLFAGKIQGDV